MKSDMKIKIVLAAILAVATLVSVSALVSAVHRADNGATPTIANGTSTRN
ncbi:hypothetical protein [Nitrobacter sp. JJSN]|jgi:hypothetical protein